MSSKLASPAYNFPISGTALDFLKILAAVLMVVDHVDDIIFGREITIMYLLGRAVFPLFCYATASYLLRIGANQTRHIGHYVVRLLVLAVLIEPVSQLSRDIDTANVLFTLAAGGVFAVWLPTQKIWARHIVFAFAVIITPLLPEPFEFGLAGALLPAAILLILQRHKGYFVWLVLLSFSMNCANAWNVLDTSLNISDVLTLILLSGTAAVIFPIMAVIFAKDISEKIRSKKRLTHKYFLHVFYPVHMALLAIINRLFFI